MKRFQGVPIWHSGLNMALTILTYISSTTNPVTYCFMNKGFRSSILSYCTRSKRLTRNMHHSRSAMPSIPRAAVNVRQDRENTIPLIKVKICAFL
ncbi:unnamed protein product [Nippostrongylus brasiliensis]|uniref:G_PROTEIN_RECEP_F1_2 domain-containing protein n=1 Tax=Nippostrongylus brasiliensis TaxID=27835 RepID=A0A0N4Y652_NIPBR|nr:unnamed protein product [Nippostrongylus brasiliensis]